MKTGRSLGSGGASEDKSKSNNADEGMNIGWITR